MNVSFIHVLDQPLKRLRLAHELASALSSTKFDRLVVVVAAVSQAALLRLDEQFSEWKRAGRTVTAIYGVDIGATSVEALQYSMEMFDSVYIARIPGIRFHPKMYIFKGPKEGLVFYGSNNFTVPGTELNLEACVRISYELPADDAQFAEQMRGIQELLAEQKSDTVFRLTPQRLKQLAREELAVPERRLAKAGESTAFSEKTATKLPKSSLRRLPPSAVPKKKLAPVVAAKSKGHVLTAVSPAVASIETLVMQIKPHDNGEIFLSKLAVDQNPAFFQWPFTGKTVPKHSGNPAYPQRVPDPVVDITVYGKKGKVVFETTNYALNTVYYSRNHEIRVTCAPIIPYVPEYSVMVMKKATSAGRDYDIDVHRPDSPMYGAWLTSCNQTMPGGGKRPRKFGWI